MIKAGAGYTNTPDAVLSGQRAARQALKQGSITEPGFAIACCAGTLDHDAFLAGVTDVLGKKTVIAGGSAIGIVTNDALSYTGHPAGVFAVESDCLRASVACDTGLAGDGYETARAVARALPQSSDDRLITLFYDSINIPPSESSPPAMHASGPLIAGIEDVRGDRVPVIGAGLLGDFGFGPTRQFCGSTVTGQSVVGMVLSGAFDVYCTIMHGYSVLDGTYHTITEIDGDIIRSVDNKPIVSVIDDIYGHRDWRRERPLTLLSIGINHGPRYDEPMEEHYVNRLITGALPDESGVRIFEPDLETGTEIQFMLRDTGEIIDSAVRNTSRLMNTITTNGKRPAFGLYIDCAGRAAIQSNTRSEEAAAVQKVMNNAGVPLFGFYTGVEIAPLLGKSRGLDLTGVLAVITEG